MANFASSGKRGGSRDGMFPGLTGVMTPEEAEAAIALAEKNPIAPKPFMDGWQNPRLNKPGFHIEGVRIEDQDEKPTAPEVRRFSTSVYDKVIPISLGKRRMAGNVIQCTAIIPRLVGTREFEITYEVPIYEDPVEVDGGAEVVGNPLCR
jgi:hypothetical protein